MRAIKLLVLRAARAAGLFRLFRHLTRNKVRILCYHGGSIGDEHVFNPLLFSRPELLDQRLAWLRDTGFTVIPLAEAVALLGSEGHRPRLPTVLTFDDGWHSTYSYLHPVIARHRVPATLYLCTRYYIEQLPNLEVALGYILWRAGRRSVEILGAHARIDGVYDLANAADRERLVAAAVNWLRDRSMARDAVCAALERIAAQLGVTATTLDLASRRFDFATRDELHDMAANGWTIELHGHIHRYPFDRPETLDADLARCRKEISEAGLPEANHYCYPSGDHDAAAHHRLAALGVRSATTCIAGLIDRADGPRMFYLRRFLDGGRIHPLEFEAEMSGFADFLRRLAGRG